jgi:hypothetical protein
MEKYDLFGTIDGLNDQLYGPNGIIERANSRILNINETIENVNSDEERENLTATIDRINGIRNQLTESKDELDRRVAVAVARDNRQKEIELLTKMKDWVETAKNIDDLNTSIFLISERLNNGEQVTEEFLRLRGERGLEIDSIKNTYLEYAIRNNIDDVATYLGENAESLNNDIVVASNYFNDGNYDEFAAFTTRKLLERIDDLQGRLDDEKEFVDIKVRDVLSDIENLKNELR